MHIDQYFIIARLSHLFAQGVLKLFRLIVVFRTHLWYVLQKPCFADKGQWCRFKPDKFFEFGNPKCRNRFVGIRSCAFQQLFPAEIAPELNLRTTKRHGTRAFRSIRALLSYSVSYVEDIRGCGPQGYGYKLFRVVIAFAEDIRRWRKPQLSGTRAKHRAHSEYHQKMLHKSAPNEISHPDSANMLALFKQNTFISRSSIRLSPVALMQRRVMA